MSDEYNNKSVKKKHYDEGLEFRNRIKEQAQVNKQKQKQKPRTLAEQLKEKKISFIKEGEEFKLPNGTTPTFISRKGKVIYGPDIGAIHLKIAEEFRPSSDLTKSLGKLFLEDKFLMIGLQEDKTGIYTVVGNCSDAQMARIKELEEQGYEVVGEIVTLEEAESIYGKEENEIIH